MFMKGLHKYLTFAILETFMKMSTKHKALCWVMWKETKMLVCFCLFGIPLLLDLK